MFPDEDGVNIAAVIIRKHTFWHLVFDMKQSSKL